LWTFYSYLNLMSGYFVIFVSLLFLVFLIVGVYSFINART
jgi:hypothetical protein